MLETYFTQKFHLSSEIEVVEVEKPSILLDFGRFSSQIPYVIYIGNLRKIQHFQLPPPISPSSSGIFEWNKFLTCLVMSQLVRKPSLKEIGALTKKWRTKRPIHPPSGWISNYHPHTMNFRSKIHENPRQQSLKFENWDHKLFRTPKIIWKLEILVENEPIKVMQFNSVT